MNFQWNDGHEGWVGVVQKEGETSGREVETMNVRSVLRVVSKEEGPWHKGETETCAGELSMWVA